MESKSRLKQRLARLFQAPTLLRAPCSYSTTSSSIFSSSAAGSTSSRRSASTDIVVDPVFLVRRTDVHVNPPPPQLFLTGKVDRSLSLPGRLDCGGCRPARTSSQRDLAKNITNKNTTKIQRFSDTTGVPEGNACPPASPSSPKKTQFEKNKKITTKSRKKKLLSNGYGFSSSSSDEVFESSSSEGEEEADTFFSSRSFSSDSSGFYQRPSSNRKKKEKKKKKQKDSNNSGRPPRHSRTRSRPNEGFEPVISMVASKKKAEEEEGGGGDRNGFPVTKRSKDPYVDFRDSMVEMIVERQMFGTKDLEQLLRSYLSLNSPHHHSVILRAFADISEVLFGH